MYNATIKQIQKIQTKSYILSVFHPLAIANIKNTFFLNSDVLEKAGDISRLKLIYREPRLYTNDMTCFVTSETRLTPYQDISFDISRFFEH